MVYRDSVTHPVGRSALAGAAELLKAKMARQCDYYSSLYRMILVPQADGTKVLQNFSFDRHPWTREMHNSDAPLNVGMKAAQMGFTETLLNRTFYVLEIKRNDVLYVLPLTKPDATDFSETRFRPALDASPHLRALFSEADNVAVKRTRLNTLYIRGSYSRNDSQSKLKSIPVGAVMLDEFEEMSDEVLPLVSERISGSVFKQIWLISTPRVPNEGIHKQYQYTNQKHWTFGCPHCSRKITLQWPDSFYLPEVEHHTDPALSEASVKCSECKALISHEEKAYALREGVWVPTNNSHIEGYHINQLYSQTITPFELAQAAVKSRSDPATEQEFHNSKLGCPHIVDGCAVTDKHITACYRNYVLDDIDLLSKMYLTLGIDVGASCWWSLNGYVFNREIKSANLNQETQGYLLACGSFTDFEESDRLMARYDPAFCVIDRMPETRKATEFARRWPGRVATCVYSDSARFRDILWHDHSDHAMVTVNRTVWLDTVVNRFIKGNIYIPKDTSMDFRQHVKALVRVYERDRNGEVKTFFRKAGADHFGHTQAYAEIALAAHHPAASEYIRHI